MRMTENCERANSETSKPGTNLKTDGLPRSGSFHAPFVLKAPAALLSNQSSRSSQSKSRYYSQACLLSFAR